MAQHDYNIADANGAIFRADLNEALEAIATSNKGNTAPSTPYAGQLWIDDNTPSSTVWTLNFYDGADWTALGFIDITNNIFRLNIAGLAALTDPAADDVLPVHDTDAGFAKKITWANALKVVNALTEDTTPDSAADFLLSYDASAGTAKKVKPGSFMRLGTVTALSSQTAVDFGSIPAWVKKITVTVVGASTNGTSNILLQIGDSGGIETSGYSGAVSNIGASLVSSDNLSGGFGFSQVNVAASVWHGAVTLTMFDPATNTWVCEGGVARSETSTTTNVRGSKSLSAALDRIRITTANGTDAFDAGSVNVLYE